MHTTTVTPTGDEYMAYCTCGWSMTAFKEDTDAHNAAVTHKLLADGKPDEADHWRDGPKVGY